jgi:pyochelin biosynthetic protein PchC
MSQGAASVTSSSTCPRLEILETRSTSRRNLVVLPHAGGSAGHYRFLQHLLPDSTRIAIARYPGRERRIAAPFAPSIEALADEISTAVMECGLHRPMILGHSMGSLVGYEVSRRLCENGEFAPPALIASGRGPVTSPTQSTVHTWDDDRLAEHLYDLGATPAGLLDSPEAREVFLPPVREDYRLVETYRPATATPLPMPVHGFAGSSDPTVSVGEVASWAEMTASAFTLTVFHGEHFFLQQDVETARGAFHRLLTTH